jgi:hypothetical protein
MQSIDVDEPTRFHDMPFSIILYSELIMKIRSLKRNLYRTVEHIPNFIVDSV